MPKSKKQKKIIRKRTTAKKRTYGIDVADDTVITVPETLRPRAKRGTDKLEDFADASEERASIISAVKGLEGQVETVFKLNEILGVQLDASQNKWSEELAARLQSEVQAERRMEASEASKVTLERELAGTIQDAQALRDEVEEFRAKAEKLQDELASADNRTAELRIQLEDQQATNRELMEAKTHLENEIKMATINYDAAKNELEAFKNALRDIRSEAARTNGRVRKRCFKPNNSCNPSYRTETRAPKTKKKPAQSPSKKKKVATPKKKTTRRKTKKTAKN